MAETSIPILPTPEHFPDDTLPLPGQATSSISPDATLTPILVEASDPNAPAALLEPAGSAAQPVPEEEELDELIIEDFTIDGICGVY
jgi:mycofactocin precursor